MLTAARVEQQSRSTQADKVTLLLRSDNTIERVLGDGNVQMEDTSTKGFKITAPQGELVMAGKQQIRSGVLSGGVAFDGSGPSPAHGTAKRLLLDFGPRNESHTQTTITASQFEARFNAHNHASSISGTSNVKTVSTTPGKPDQITTSRDLLATFNDQNAIQEVDQTGDFHFQQGQQTATSDRARYLPAEETITLTGSPRVQDSGGTITAESIQLNRKTNIALAQRNVKTTYTDLKPQPNGGMLGSADPIHVTGTSMVANRNTGIAKFSNARLWQTANIVEAPTITFDREHRSLKAEASSQSRVNSVFVQADKNGKTVPVNVTADKLTYVDAERKATFNGNVVVHGSETTINADTVQVFLLPRGDQAGSQLDRIVAQGEIQIEQPGRKATGNQLVYTAADDKLVLTASAGKRPSILDSQRGQITGDSLTFYRHDDRVVVESKKSSQTLIQTRIQDASKK